MHRIYKSMFIPLKCYFCDSRLSKKYYSYCQDKGRVIKTASYAPRWCPKRKKLVHVYRQTYLGEYLEHLTGHISRNELELRQTVEPIVKILDDEKFMAIDAQILNGDIVAFDNGVEKSYRRYKNGRFYSVRL